MQTVATSGTVADAIEQTLEWLDHQGCGATDAERRNTRRSRYRVRRANFIHAGRIGSGDRF